MRLLILVTLVVCGCGDNTDAARIAAEEQAARKKSQDESWNNALRNYAFRQQWKSLSRSKLIEIETGARKQYEEKRWRCLNSTTELVLLELWLATFEFYRGEPDTNGQKELDYHQQRKEKDCSSDQ